jgi:hypothetical protein
MSAFFQRQPHSKYHADRVNADGMTFDSKAEWRRWCDLRLLERAGRISHLERQVPYELAPAVRLEGSHRMKPAIRLFVDFRYLDESTGKLVLEDTKCVATAEKEAFRIKLHLLKSVHGLDLKLTR